MNCGHCVADSGFAEQCGCRGVGGQGGEMHGGESAEEQTHNCPLVNNVGPSLLYNE